MCKDDATSRPNLVLTEPCDGNNCTGDTAEPVLREVKFTNY